MNYYPVYRDESVEVLYFRRRSTPCSSADTFLKNTNIPRGHVPQITCPVGPFYPDHVERANTTVYYFLGRVNMPDGLSVVGDERIRILVETVPYVQ